MNLTSLRLGCIAAACVTLSAHAAEPLVVKIGHVAALSGSAAHLGRDNENGVRMAIEELNARNVQIGGRPARFELLSEDDAGDPKQGTAAAQKLVDNKVNGVVGHLNSGTAIPASRIYADAGIPQIAPSVTNPRYTRRGYKTTFRMVADDAQLGGTLGRYAVQTLNAKTIAVIDDRTAYGQGVASEFEKAAKAAGATIAKREFTSDKATDFTAILTGIKAVKPDVIFYGGMDAVAGPMLRQMKQLGIQAKFVGGDGVCTAELPKLASGQLSDDQVICAIAGGVDAAQRPAFDNFKADFKKKFGTEVQIYSPYTYDATKVMVEAMVKAGSADPAKYLPTLQKINYPGVTGTVAFDDKGDIRNGALTLYTFKGGQRQELGVVRCDSRGPQPVDSPHG